MTRVPPSAIVFGCCLLISGVLSSAPSVATPGPSIDGKRVSSGATLRVTVLPSNIKGKIRVTGPSGYVRTIKVRGTRSVSGLKPGRYTLKAKSLPSPSGRIKPLRAKKAISVKKRSRVTVRFTYFVPNTV